MDIESCEVWRDLPREFQPLSDAWLAALPSLAHQVWSTRAAEDQADRHVPAAGTHRPGRRARAHRPPRILLTCALAMPPVPWTR